MAILSFGDKHTEDFYYTGSINNRCGWKSVASVALRKLDMINYANDLLDLRSPPGNRLEELKGNLKGHHSIRVNDQWRIMFIWTAQGPKEVRICDYH